jgi:hypothetical protein
LRIGRAQIERLRRPVPLDGRGAEPRDPADIGSAQLLDQQRRRRAPPASSAPEPTMRAGPLVAARTASLSGAIRGDTTLRPPGPNTCM